MNYQKIYCNLIESRKVLIRSKKDGYYESHHIIPVCIGGCKKCKDNMVLLTPREHFLAHWLLSRIYPKNDKIQYAFWCMCIAINKHQSRKIFSSIAYQESRESYIKIKANKLTGKVGYWKNKKRPDRSGDKHPMFGKGHLQTGEKNPMFGKPAPNRRKIITIDETLEFESVQAAAKYFQISSSTVCLWIKKNKNIQYKQ